MERFRPEAVRVDHNVYRRATPGVWTFVLHRLDNDERVSVTRRLFEGDEISGTACEALPEELGDFERESCRRGVVPTGTFTNYWGLKARYLNGSCRANAFALPLSDAIRTMFDESYWASGPERSFPEGVVHEIELDGFTARAWLAHHHLYIVAGADGLPGFDGLVRGLLDAFPVVGGPATEIPTCDETGAVAIESLAPTTLDALRDQAQFHTHFEGNRASGVRVSFHDQHPLAQAGLRRGEIVHTADGARLHHREDIDPVLERMTRVGTIELVVSRERLSHPRCIRLTIKPPGTTPPIVVAPPPPPPPPPPPNPGRGRHCERATDQCWHCVDLTFPADLNCRRRCRGDQLCVRRGGRDQCLPATRVCCLPNTPCNVPPGCDGAASSCASTTPGGRNERCTFLNACAQPLPTP
jgi:hypothetical protein